MKQIDFSIILWQNKSFSIYISFYQFHYNLSYNRRLCIHKIHFCFTKNTSSIKLQPYRLDRTRKDIILVKQQSCIPLFQAFHQLYNNLISTSKIMNLEEQPQVKMEEEQIMIMLGEVEQCEGQSHQDLLDILVAEPTTKKKSSNGYDYKPAPVPIPPNDIEGGEITELKTSNNSTSTCEGEPVVRKCTCLKTRCMKNYCECFKQGLACTSECVCVSCCNRQRLFLNRSNPQTTKCKCQKSHCLKKYCECHSVGKKCGPACKCLECENIEEEVMNMGEYDVKIQEEEDICAHYVFLDI